MESLDTNLNILFQWLLRATFQGSLLACLILAIKLVLRERLSARWHYCLWLVLLVRLSLPWGPQSRLSIYNLVPRPFSSHHAIPAPADDARSGAAVAKPGTSGQEGSGELPLTGTQGEAPQRGQDGAAVSASPVVASRQSDGAVPGIGRRPFAESVASVAPWLWLGGCLVLGGYILLRAFGLWWAVRCERPVTDQQILDLLEDCKMQMRVRTLVGVVVTDRTRSPALFGFLRPRILLPQGLIETLGLDELHYVFLHEMAHLKRRDIYLAWLVCLLQVLHWFNPLIWFAFRRMRADQEMAADALALVIAGTDETRLYGRTIVNLLERFSRPQYLPSLAGILENPSHIERRIQMIARFNRTSHRPLLAAMLVALFGLVALTDAQNRSGGGKPGEKTDTTPTKEASAPARGGSAGASEQAVLVGDSNVFVDPQTGIRFTKYKTISGPSDVVAYGYRLNLAPNTRFLLDEWLVIPLDGGKPFDLVDIPNACRGTLSPDGRKVVFYADGMWLIEVDPETGRPVGSAKKLREGFYVHGNPVRWSSDSKRIVFESREAQLGSGPRILSIENGEVSQIVDPLDFGLVSPDGKMVAWSDGQGVTRDNSLRVKPVAGGEARKISDAGYPVAWSANSEWLVCSPARGGGAQYEIRLVRVADGREVKLDAPGCWIQQGRYSGKPLFFQTSYGSERRVLKVVSTAGGPPAELGSYSNLRALGGNFPYYLFWTREAPSILVEGKGEGDGWGFWAFPLDGKHPQSLTIDTPLFQQADFRIVSPDGDRLLLGVREGRSYNLWVVPVSLSQMKSTSEPVKVFDGMVQSSTMGGVSWPFSYAWSPDSRRIAFSHNGDIWVVGADGQNPVQLTETPEQDLWPDWSPDGTMIAFRRGDFSESGPVLRVVPASGGEARVIGAVSENILTNAWSPGGKELTIVPRDEEAIFSFPISGGDARTVLRLKDKGIDKVCRLRWSPDGRLLAFQADNGGRNQRLCIYRPDTGGLERCDNEYGSWYWSPDSKWVSFFSEPSVKVRPESVLWEMDVEDAAARLGK